MYTVYKCYSYTVAVWKQKQFLACKEIRSIDYENWQKGSRLAVPTVSIFWKYLEKDTVPKENLINEVEILQPNLQTL